MSTKIYIIIHRDILGIPSIMYPGFCLPSFTMTVYHKWKSHHLQKLAQLIFTHAQTHTNMHLLTHIRLQFSDYSDIKQTNTLTETALARTHAGITIISFQKQLIRVIILKRLWVEKKQSPNQPWKSCHSTTV